MAEETYSRNGPTCPYCGHLHNPDEDPSFYYNECLEEMECSECGEEIHVSVYTATSWTCQRVDE